MQKLSEAELRKLDKQGFLLLPTDISWRRASDFQRRGIATIYPFHQRWQGRLDFTPAGRALLDTLSEAICKS